MGVFTFKFCAIFNENFPTRTNFFDSFPTATAQNLTGAAFRPQDH